MPLKHDYFTYAQCDVITVANTKAIIPAGRHLTVELSTGNGGVSVRPVGVSIDISYSEWKRLQDQNLVRQ